MTQYQNQFAMTAEKGQVDLDGLPTNVLSCEVSASETATIAVGEAVKIENSAGGVPKVLALDAATDKALGFVIKTQKDDSYVAGDRLQVAIDGTVIILEAGAAIARGANVEFQLSGAKVITSAGVNPIVGYALDKATADGDLIRVYVLAQAKQVISDIIGLQTAISNNVKQIKVTATLAEINAGKEIIPAATGKKIRVVNYAARVVGGFAATTSVDLQSGDTGTKVTVLAVAGLTNGAVLQPTSANTTLGAGFAADLEEGESLVVANVGDDATTGTSITFTITYTYI